jgi:hypothetical protein
MSEQKQVPVVEVFLHTDEVLHPLDLVPSVPERPCNTLQERENWKLIVASGSEKDAIAELSRLATCYLALRKALQNEVPSSENLLNIEICDTQ